ncbi:MAG: tRNA preQ1(34) S-adenosylmethionine ribosyltransferase-isomerase QueA [Phycisphaerales bacterium]|nr:tRNA preQ1(34) S-adenosylmethionine ribosyltransferase-isomerase QueA [Phycisphaerales bacterium]
MLRTDALDYELPPGRIATHPVEPRDAARLLVVRQEAGWTPEHRHIRDLPELLGAGDRMVVNTSRVLPARFLGVREDTGGHAEGLYLHDAPEASPGHWIAMIKARRHRPGARIRLTRAGKPSAFSLELVALAPHAPGAWLVRLLADLPSADGPPSALEVLEAVGLTPLPPYILAARKAGHDAGDDAIDRDQYQTVYAGAEQAGSVAAPTAGLHFTPALLARLCAAGVARTEVVLHVGAGTFKPVETDLVEQHPMHAEWCSMNERAVGEVEATRAAGGRVFAIGTTSARTLESYAPRAEERATPPGHLSTRLLVTPGHAFRWVDGLLTNFHLPRSTLMALVAARLQEPDEPPLADGTPPGVARLKSLYAAALDRGYRFYSFGDAMLILPARSA